MRTGDPFGPSAVSLAAVHYGAPVLDARGAPVGRVVDVGSGNIPAQSFAGGEPPDPWPADEALQGLGFVRVTRYGPAGHDLVISADRIAYVADDHLRLSEIFDDAVRGAEPD
ncbi:hypothetical protein [Kribbella sp. CA-247076]|uniref:hypothetical protein n=1 Tax=Kribbella sp. CA-247076 TaxID=3239941 RepID=UPI003D9189FF